MNSIIPPYMEERILAFKERTKNAQYFYNPSLSEIEQAIANASSEKTDEVQVVLSCSDDLSDDPQWQEALERAKALEGYGILVRGPKQRKEALK